MSDIYSTYQQQFIKNLSSISKKIQSIAVQSSYKKQMAFVEIKEDIQQCEMDLKKMETEIGGFDVQIKFQYTRKLRNYKRDLDEIKKKLYKAEDQFALQKNKEMLMGAQIQEQKYTKKDKQKLIKQGQLLSDTTYKLKDSVKIMRQNQDISNNVGIQLVRHSEQMKGQKQKLLEMNHDIDKSERVIKSIMMRIRKNKFMLGLIVGIVVIIGIIILIIHFARN